MRSTSRQDERGFALALVVLLLFAVGVLGATGYQMAVLSSELAVQGKEGQKAFSIARAGLQRYMAEQIGVPADTVTYSIEGGNAVVTSRMIAQKSDTVSIYLVESEGVYLEPLSTSSAARRTLYQYAEHRDVPFDLEAAVVMAVGNLIVEGGGKVKGNDKAKSDDCVQTTFDAAGALMGSGTASWGAKDLDGSPDEVTLGAYQTVLDSIGLTWDVFDDPNFVPDYEDRWADLSLPTDSFPVVRFTGNVTGGWWNSGRGVLIVQGRLIPRDGFNWDGIVMAERIRPRTNASSWEQTYRLRGIVVSGLNEPDASFDDLRVTDDANIEFNRCYAYQAGRSLGYFRPVEDAWWEGS